MEATGNNSAAKRHPRKTERKIRSTLSCEACRSRKLKCNREKPCQNCMVRDNDTACIYRGEPAPQLGRRHVPHSEQAEDMQARINRLESLVTTLVKQNLQLASSDGNGAANYTSADQSTPFSSSGSDNSITEEIQQGIGVLQVNEKQSMYKGSTHWYDVLEELNELKSLWGQMQETQDVLAAHNPSLIVPDAPSLLYGMARPVSKEELLATIPTKPACDKLMARFFDDEDASVPTFHLLHQPTFMKQYEEHWKDPSKTPIMWLGLLFSMICPAMFSYHLIGDEPPEYEGTSRALSELYRVRTAQCLMIGDITKCAPFTLETLLYNTMAEWSRKTGSEHRVWMMVGVVVRVALQMGYHRDPSQFPEISLFQGEMRRRLWNFVSSTDSLSSFLTGMPGMVRKSDVDTALPRNLFDWELSEDMTELPPARTETAETPVSYLMAKGNILHVLGDIVDFLSAIGPLSYATVIKLDGDLAAALAGIPPYLKMQNLELPVSESASLVNRRIQLVFLHHQGQCVLHRKFFIRGRNDVRYAPSYERCLSSALALLRLQDFLYNSSKHSLLISTHWYRVNYTSHEFILAAMIIVLDIRHRKMEGNHGVDPVSGVLQPECVGVLYVLQKACDIWKDEAAQTKSPEAIKVSQVLSNLLSPLGFFEFLAAAQPQRLPEMPALEPPLLPLDGLENEALGEMDIDWGAWDSFVEGTSFEDAYGVMPF